ncbi:YqzL family protein [Clostridiaceae bacterium 35-E11]
MYEIDSINTFMKGDNRVLEKMFWNLFLNTGDVNIYLYYKDIQGEMNKKDKKEKEIVQHECS